MTDVMEERLRRTLDEVAGRLAVREDLAPPTDDPGRLSAPSHRLPYLAAAAVAVLGLVAASIVVARRDDPASVTSRPVPASASRTLLTAPLEGDERVELRYDRARRCVELHFPSGDDPSYRPDACGTGEALALQATIRTGKTVVYGIAEGAVRFTHTVIGAGPGQMLHAGVPGGAAFVLVVDSLEASGTVVAFDRRNQEVGRSGFDHGGPERPAKELVGSAEIAVTYQRDGTVYAVTDDGRTVRLGDGTVVLPDGTPSVAPDGHTVFFSVANMDGIFDTPTALDARTGTRRETVVVPSTFSPDGRFGAGVQPVDDDVERQVVAMDLVTLAEVERVSVPRETAIGRIESLTWDPAGNRLVMVTEGGASLWSVNLTTGATTRLADRSDGTDRWTLADRADQQGRIVALRRRAGTSEWGHLRVEAGTARFDRVATVGSATLTAAERMFLVPVSSGLARGRDGTLISIAGPGGVLLGDGRDLYRLGDDGTLTLLLTDVTGASGLLSAPTG